MTTFLITGGTGSFGNAMAARLLADHPDCQVRIFSRDEVKQAEMRARFRDDSRLRFLLGDVRDVDRLEEAMRGVDTVFHAAALKRVEACAYDPEEAIRTNVFGSMNVAAAAKACVVGRVVALSTDKACAPSTTYGATKLCMEAVFTSSTANAERRPVFSVVRYGNVMGSRGGVLGIWRDAIAAGRPVPMTDPAATRFWFSVMGAVDLALWAAANARGGELIVPKLPAFTLADLAAAMGATAVATMALRPLEKQDEVMVSVDESRDFRVRPKAFGAVPMDLLVRYLPGEEEGPEYGAGAEYSSRIAPRLGIEALKERLA